MQQGWLTTLTTWLMGLCLSCLIMGEVEASDMPPVAMVEDGQPRARIVIDGDAPRVVTLAAEELQTYVKKITGATLPIVSIGGDKPLNAANETPVDIYIGVSDATRRLGLDEKATADLKDGAFRIVRGPTWLALLGHDEAYKPTPPYFGFDQPSREKMYEQWHARAKDRWRNPAGALHRQVNQALGISSLDKRGSLNAVYHFLRSQGVEWYMAGELGEVVPTKQTIMLPAASQEVHPDMPLRLLFPIANIWLTQPAEQVLWSLRLGLNARSEFVGRWVLQSHGMRNIMTPGQAELHPKYFALHGDKRDPHLPCLSQPGLVEEYAAYLRTMFDVYDVPMLSLMPPDGFARICECELCKGKDSPERGFQGLLSDYVWDFVNRVAVEVYKTHPDKLLSCYAYNTFLLPPTNGKKLSPNIVVGMVHGRSGNYRDSKTRSMAASLRQQWLDLSSHKLLIWEHTPFTHRGVIWPAFEPHKIAADLKAAHEQTAGELVEFAWGPMNERGHGLHSPGVNHLNAFITARMYWDINADVDAMLDTYYQQYYGPSAAPMKELVEYCEANWQAMRGSAEKITPVFDLLAKAKALAPADSPYAKRLALLEDYLQPLKLLREQLAIGRENVIVSTARSKVQPAMVIDGVIDEALWADATPYRLRNVVTGRRPRVETNFRMLWGSDEKGKRESGTLYMAIECEDPQPEALNITADKHDDPNIWNGDCVELLIETQAHSYYQIVIAPNGHVVDIDRQGNMVNTQWDSNFEIRTSRTATGWSIELAIPVSGSDQTTDPLHDLVGQRPRDDFPWFYNVCRQRVRGDDRELTAFSPTGKAGFHDVLKFAKLQVR